MELTEYLKQWGLESDDPNSEAFIIAPVKRAISTDHGSVLKGTPDFYYKSHDDCIKSLEERLGIDIRSCVRFEHGLFGRQGYLSIILLIPKGGDFHKMKREYIALWENSRWALPVEYFENHIRPDVRAKIVHEWEQFDLGLRLARLRH
jgi:hypothetical protein